MRADTKTENAVMDVLKQCFEAFGRRDLDALLAFFAPDPDVVVIGTGRDEKGMGPADIKAIFERAFGQFSEASFEFGWHSVSVAGPLAWLATDVSYHVKAGDRESSRARLLCDRSKGVSSRHSRVAYSWLLEMLARRKNPASLEGCLIQRGYFSSGSCLHQLAVDSIFPGYISIVKRPSFVDYVSHPDSLVVSWTTTGPLKVQDYRYVISHKVYDFALILYVTVFIKRMEILAFEGCPVYGTAYPFLSLCHQYPPILLYISWRRFPCLLSGKYSTTLITFVGRSRKGALSIFLLAPHNAS